MAHYDHVTRVIFAKVKPPIKPLAYLGLTPPKQDPLPVLNVRPEHMPILMVPRHVRIVTTMHTNRHPMRRHAFWCKQGITNPVQQPKLNARRVKQEAVAMLCVTIAWKEPFKARQVKPLATTAPADGAIPATDRPAATPYHQDRTHQTVFKPSANAVTLVPVPTNPKRLVQMARTPTTRAPSPAFPVHRVKFPANKEVLNASNVPRDIYNLIRNNQNVLQSNLDQSWPKEDLPR